MGRNDTATPRPMEAIRPMPVDPVLPPAARQPVESWAKAKGHNWQLASTAAHEQWPQGLEVTEAQYDDAVRRATGVALR